jgi:hypothetical protein
VCSSDLATKSRRQSGLPRPAQNVATNKPLKISPLRVFS